MPDSPCFGIDLGTTASAIALVQDGVPRVLHVDGADLVPSVLLFHPDGQLLVGQAALNALPLHPTRGVQSAKRRMGSDHTWSPAGKPITPVDVAEHVLRKLCAGAEASCGVRPRRVVITVPAWFTQAQRADTRTAGERAGLDVVAIINEPTAAALAHAQGSTHRRRVLVYDLGGGTFDVSVVDQDGTVLEVVASHGDSLLGGDDIDAALMAHVLERLSEEQPRLHSLVVDSQAARVRLRLAVEAAKVDLSTHLATTIRIPFLVDDGDDKAHLELVVERSELEAVSGPIIQRTMSSVHQVLADAGVGPAELDDLVLVGGATLQPQVWHMLHHDLGMEGSHAISPRRAVVLGAALHGAILDGATHLGVLVDVAPYSLSVGVVMRVGGQEMFGCRVITPRNAPLPAVHSEQFFTMYPGQTELKVPIYQGGSRSSERNVFLGTVECTGLPTTTSASDWSPRAIRVTLHHDRDGMVRMDVVDVLSGHTGQGRVASDGAEQVALREAFMADAVPDVELAPPGPGELDFGTSPEAVGEVWQAGGDDEEDEVARTFANVLDPGLDLTSLVGDAADGMLEQARAGQQALEAGDADTAEQIFDALTDRLLDHGVFL